MRDPDLAYQREQYGDAARLRMRIESHRRYSERDVDFVGWLLDRLDLRRGQRVLDAACGPGAYHATLAARGALVTGIDQSAGMARGAAASAATHDASIALADITRLPFRAAAFDRTMANHALYHVPDVRGALDELRRVTRTGGRVAIATNAADHSARLREVHAEAARACGLTPAPLDTDRFTLDDLDLVREVFPAARVEVLANAFVFPDADAALDYYGSAQIDAIEPRPAGNAHRAPMIAAARTIIERIITREGAFRVPKDAGCFVADV